MGGDMFLQFIAVIFSLASAVEGSFHYYGDYNVLSSIRHENVYPASPQGKKRLTELKSEGYVCQAKLQFIQCKKSSSHTTPPPGMLIEPNMSAVEFGPLLSLNLIVQGDQLTISDALQTVSIDGVSYSKAQYLERPNLVKVSVGAAGQLDYRQFVVYNSFLGVIGQVVNTESQWVYTTYSIEYYFKNSTRFKNSFLFF